MIKYVVDNDEGNEEGKTIKELEMIKYEVSNEKVTVDDVLKAIAVTKKNIQISMANWENLMEQREIIDIAKAAIKEYAAESDDTQKET